MRGVNKVILVGTLGQDPDTRYTQGGTAITTISIATNEAWTDKTSGEKQERTEWHRVKLFGKLAEIAGQYLAKGRQVYIEGSLRTDKWTDKDGVERYTTNIIGDELQMLGGNPGGGGEKPQQRDDGYGQPRGNPPPRGNQPSARERAAAATQGTQRYNEQRSAPPINEGFDDEDIPF